MAQILDVNGNPIYPAKPISYLMGFNIRHTAADAAASAVMAFRNPAASSKIVCVRAIRGLVDFDGTAAAATSLCYELIRFSAGDPTTGTTMVRVKKRTGLAASQILDANAQFKSGILTMTAVVYDAAPFAYIRLPASVTNGIGSFEWKMLEGSGFEYEMLELAAGEGIAMRLTNAAIIGQGIAGTISIDER
jgi:hypothetical protein